MAAGFGYFDGDAADCGSALRYFLQCRYHCLGVRPAMALGLGSLASMQQTAVLRNVISYSAVIGACVKGLWISSL